MKVIRSVRSDILNSEENRTLFLSAIKVFIAPMLLQKQSPLAASPIQIRISARYDFKKTNWLRFQNKLSGHGEINIDMENAERINMDINKWREHVIKAMDNNIPKIRYHILPHPKSSPENSRMTREQ